MKGAIFYSSKYGSTAQYANWISEATGLPVFNVKDVNSDPSKYDFLILGQPNNILQAVNPQMGKKAFGENRP